MNTAVMLVAAAGLIAVAWRTLSALLLVLRFGAVTFLAGDVAETRARRGDLTGLADATDAHALARRRRFAAVRAFFLWGGLLIVPPLTAWPELLYACYSLLWLVPRRRTAVQHP